MRTTCGKIQQPRKMMQNFHPSPFPPLLPLDQISSSQTREKYRLPIGGSSGPSQPPIGAEPKIRAPPLATLIAPSLSLVRGTERVGVEGGRGRRSRDRGHAGGSCDMKGSRGEPSRIVIAGRGRGKQPHSGPLLPTFSASLSVAK